MKFVKQVELDVIAQQGRMGTCTIIELGERKWTFILDVTAANAGAPAEYRLVTQRGDKRLWSDPRVMLRFLRRHYGIESGQFQLRRRKP